jgi:hypothetical protein
MARLTKRSSIFLLRLVESYYQGVILREPHERVGKLVDFLLRVADLQPAVGKDGCR